MINGGGRGGTGEGADTDTPRSWNRRDTGAAPYPSGGSARSSGRCRPLLRLSKPPFQRFPAAEEGDRHPGTGVPGRGRAVRLRAGGEAPPPSRGGGQGLGLGLGPGRGGGRSGWTAGTMQLLLSLSPVTWLLLIAFLCLVAL